MYPANPCNGSGSFLPAGRFRGAPAGQVTINPFARWKYKEWDNGKWVEVIRWLRKEKGYLPVIVGSREEQEAAAGIVAGAGRRGR